MVNRDVFIFSVFAVFLWVKCSFYVSLLGFVLFLLFKKFFELCTVCVFFGIYGYTSVNVVSNGLWSLFLCKMKFMRFSKINFLVEKRSSHSQQHFAPSFLSHLHHSSLVVVAFDLFYREKETQRRGRRGEKVECR